MKIRVLTRCTHLMFEYVLYNVTLLNYCYNNAIQFKANE